MNDDKNVPQERNEAQEEYDNNPELRALLARAAQSPTVKIKRRPRRS